jgi:hypothetical protein
LLTFSELLLGLLGNCFSDPGGLSAPVGG